MPCVCSKENSLRRYTNRTVAVSQLQESLHGQRAGIFVAGRRVPIQGAGAGYIRRGSIAADGTGANLGKEIRAEDGYGMLLRCRGVVWFSLSGTFRAQRCAACGRMQETARPFWRGGLSVRFVGSKRWYGMWLPSGISSGGK